MKRQNLTDGTGWFDLDQAQSWEEDAWWNGHNHVSVATRSAFDHEEVYRTAQGLFILHFWSQYQGRPESWRVLEPDEAYSWLLRNKHYDAVPAEFLAAQEL